MDRAGEADRLDRDSRLKIPDMPDIPDDRHAKLGNRPGSRAKRRQLAERAHVPGMRRRGNRRFMIGRAAPRGLKCLPADCPGKSRRHMQDRKSDLQQHRQQPEIQADLAQQRATEVREE